MTGLSRWLQQTLPGRLLLSGTTDLSDGDDSSCLVTLLSTPLKIRSLRSRREKLEDWDR